MWFHDASTAWQLRTAQLSGGDRSHLILSPAAAETLGYLDRNTGLVPPRFRANAPQGVYNLIDAVTFSAGGREFTCPAVVCTVATATAEFLGEALIALPTYVTASLGFTPRQVVERRRSSNVDNPLPGMVVDAIAGAIFNQVRPAPPPPANYSSTSLRLSFNNR